MRATRQEGSGEECRVALIATSEARRNCPRKPISLFCGGFYLKFEPFSPKIRRCDFSLNEMRSRSATLFFGGNLKKVESDGTAGGVWGGMPCRPPLCFWGGRR